jgi:hypothetical protein
MGARYRAFASRCAPSFERARSLHSFATLPNACFYTEVILPDFSIRNAISGPLRRPLVPCCPVRRVGRDSAAWGFSPLAAAAYRTKVHPEEMQGAIS